MVSYHWIGAQVSSFARASNGDHCHLRGCCSCNIFPKFPKKFGTLLLLRVVWFSSLIWSNDFFRKISNAWIDLPFVLDFPLTLETIHYLIKLDCCLWIHFQLVWIESWFGWCSRRCGKIQVLDSTFSPMRLFQSTDFGFYIGAVY